MQVDLSRFNQNQGPLNDGGVDEVVFALLPDMAKVKVAELRLAATTLRAQADAFEQRADEIERMTPMDLAVFFKEHQAKVAREQGQAQALAMAGAQRQRGPSFSGNPRSRGKRKGR